MARLISILLMRLLLSKEVDYKKDGLNLKSKLLFLKDNANIKINAWEHDMKANFPKKICTQIMDADYHLE